MMGRIAAIFFAPTLAMVAVFGGITMKPRVGRPSNPAPVTKSNPSKPVRPKSEAAPIMPRVARVSAFSTTRVGWIGDAVTKRHWQAKGWTQLKSKYHGERGIDTVMVQKKGGVTRVALIENKVNGATLSKGQMSEMWLRQKVAEMKTSGSKGISDHARIIEKALDGSEGYRVYRILANYSVKDGTTTYFKLNAEGKPVRQIAQADNGALMDGVITEMGG